MCAYAETLESVQLIKYMQFMLHQLYLKKAVIKLARIKQKVEGRCFGAFSDAPEISSRGLLPALPISKFGSIFV